MSSTVLPYSLTIWFCNSCRLALTQGGNPVHIRSTKSVRKSWHYKRIILLQLKRQQIASLFNEDTMLAVHNHTSLEILIVSVILGLSACSTCPVFSSPFFFWGGGWLSFLCVIIQASFLLCLDLNYTFIKILVIHLCSISTKSQHACLNTNSF